MRSFVRRVRWKEGISIASSTEVASPRRKSVHPMLLLQHQIGNQAVQHLLPSGTLQSKLDVSEPEDGLEREADQAAQQIVSTRTNRPQMTRDAPKQNDENEESVKSAIHSPDSLFSNVGLGTPLDSSTRAFMERRFDVSFEHVRVHMDKSADILSRGLIARAFTSGEDVFFRANEYNPSSSAGRELLAHELTHVVQQGGGPQGGGRHMGSQDRVPNIQRTVEFHPPGRGEASAFDRRQELVDRLNANSSATRYRLDGQKLRYDVVPDATPKFFDTQMRGFMDRAEVIPFRLITKAGFVEQQLPSGAIGFGPLLIDSLQEAYLDVDDMLASDDLTFQLQWMHILTERSKVKDYARRIGTSMEAEFPGAHSAGREAEAKLLADEIGDPSIRYVYDEDKPNGTHVVGFRSSEHYWVFKVFQRIDRPETGGNVWVLTRDKRKITVAELKVERAVAAVIPPAVPGPLPAPPPESP
jgi:Domain of unknown function (DUF4157)